ncbi:MAG TPA: hypothetical protein VJA94_08225 [Candidatus Angelobacter sp.]
MLIVLILIAAILAFLGTVIERRIQLKVTNLEFQTYGGFGNEFRNVRAMPSADILWLEHQDSSGGGDAPDHPEGLYAVLRCGSSCVLPYVDPGQANQVIDSIEERFPDMAKRWRTSRGPFDCHFITLGLSSQKPD